MWHLSRGILLFQWNLAYWLTTQTHKNHILTTVFRWKSVTCFSSNGPIIWKNLSRIHVFTLNWNSYIMVNWYRWYVGRAWKLTLSNIIKNVIQLSIGRERTTMLDWTYIGITKYKINTKISSSLNIWRWIVSYNQL